MLSYRQALRKILKRVPGPTVQELPLNSTQGLVLAETIRSDRDLPPFRKSCMDGYAVRFSDLGSGVARLKVAGVISAGPGATRRLQAGEAWQIMTGAPVPDGADTVQIVEKTRQTGDFVEILELPKPGANISPQGNEIKQGQVALKSGTVIGPPEIGVLATFGKSRVKVFRPLRVGIVSTGDELVPVEADPGPGQIRNSNTPMLLAQCRRLGLEADTLPVVPDRAAAVSRTLRSGLRGRDALVLSGGVSMGEFDFVHQVLEKEGVEITFHKAAIKPGKPLVVGYRGEKMVFGLPGNPVSSFVTFEVFARPAFRKWMGYKQLELPLVTARLSGPVRQKPGRLFFKPARTAFEAGQYHTHPIETRGSADIVAFCRSNSLLLVPPDKSSLRRGAKVEVLLLEGRD